MKLKNKKTGEIYELNEFCLYDDKGFAKRPFLKSLAELNEEWEDYEEPKGIKEIYFIGATVHIGMYNQKEAIEAVEKLKAWKRLKDKGFRFTAWKNGIFLDGTIAGQVRYEFPIDNKDDIEKDLDLLFGGEE